MRFTTDILTPLTAFCFFGSSSDLSAQEKQFHQLVVTESTASGAAADAVFVEMQFYEQADDGQVNLVSAQGMGVRSGSKALQETTLPKGPLLFASNSLNLTARNRKSLECAAAWLREHPEDRILIVGYCDDSGSEACTAELAGHRAQVVRQFLLSLGTRADQIAGVKGWKNVDRACRAGVPECQRQNRSVRLFAAERTGSLK
jgi:outer membrane protein OmpA-like peptidoglycan-associated protein